MTKSGTGADLGQASAHEGDGVPFSVPAGLSEDELRQLIAAGADWAWETDAELRFSWLSENYESISGIKPATVLGRFRFDFLHQISKGSRTAAAHMEDLQARRPFRNFAYELKGGRKECRWVSTTGFPRYSDDGVFVGYRGVAHNVTGLAASLEEAAATSAGADANAINQPPVADDNHAQRMMAALNIMSDAFCYYDSGDTLALYNAALVTMYRGLEDIIRPGVRFHELVDAGLERGLWDTQDLSPRKWRDAMIAGRKIANKPPTVIRFSDGRCVMHREIHTDDGGIMSIHTDVTELENRRAELARAGEHSKRLLFDLERTIDSMEMGIVLLDAGMNAEIINKAFFAIWKLQPGEIEIGSPFRALMDINRHNGIYDVADDDWERYVASRLDEIRAGEVAPREFHRADGRTMIYSVTALSGGKRLVSYFDITDMKSQEAQLASTHERSKLAEAVINSIKDPIFVKDSDLKFVFVNEAFAAMNGRTVRDMLGRRAGDFANKTHATQYEASERHVLVTGDRYEIEEDFEFAGIGNARIVRKNRVRTESGNLYVAGFLFDISEMKRRETEAEKARNHLATVLESMPAAVIIYDSEDKFVFANKKLQDSLPVIKPAWQPGRTFQESLLLGHANGCFRSSGDPEVDKLYETDPDRWLDGMMAHYHLRSSIFERRNPDGRWYQVYDTRTDDGTFIGVRVDITELKERETALQESMRENEVFRSLIDNVPVSIYAKRSDLRQFYVNKGWCDLTGFTKEEAIGKTDIEIFGAEGQAFADGDLAVLRTGETQEIEETVTAADGSFRYQFARKGAMVASDGSLYLIGSTTDITELKQREADLLVAQQKAVLADRAKSEFLANMSHEIRTPMNGVLGMAELLAKSELDPKQRTFTDIIVKSGNALLTIINDILDFSKIDAGQLVLDPAPFNLAEAVEDVATLVSTRAKEKDLELIVRVAPNLHDLFVGDVGRIRQIITNLVGNAVKFTESGHVLIDVSGNTADGMAALRISVTDTGIGIPAEKLGLVFEKFSQVDASSTRRHEGTGLGLAITSRLVQLMGGEIGVESRERVGSTFWFTISLPTAGRPAGRKVSPVDVSGARVLIVDDNPVNRTILMEQMMSWGFDACAAESGQLGLKILSAAAGYGVPVDCVVLDYQMPGMSGAEMARIVRSTPQIADSPIVMLTSVDQSLSSPIYRDIAIDSQLIKPARSSTLLEALVSAIQRRRSARSVQKGGSVEMTLPAAPEPSKPARIRNRPADADGHHLDILVAEDNEVNQLVFTQILSETDFTFQIVGNGKLAVAAFSEMNPRMILMDVSMPEMNGLEATAVIRRLEASSDRRIPIIGVTAHALKGDRERCLEAGMDDYLPKPISPRALLDKVERWDWSDSARARDAV